MLLQFGIPEQRFLAEGDVLAGALEKAFLGILGHKPFGQPPAREGPGGWKRAITLSSSEVPQKSSASRWWESVEWSLPEWSPWLVARGASRLGS